MNTAFLPNLSAPSPTIALDLRTALLNSAGQIGMVRQTLAAAGGGQPTVAELGGREAVLSLVQAFDSVAAELAAQMSACAALIDGSAAATRAIEEYRRTSRADTEDDEPR